MFHKEGGKIILISTFLTTVIILSSHYIFPNTLWLEKTVQIAALIMLILVLQFFRNPDRHLEVNDYNIVAPVDGKVVVIEEVEEPEFFKGKRLQVSVFMSPFNVHVNRNPVSGVVKYFRYHPGKYLVA